MINGINYNNRLETGNYSAVAPQGTRQAAEKQDGSVFTNSAQFKADTAQLQQDKSEISALIQRAKSGDPEAIRELKSIKPQEMNSNSDSNAQLQNQITQMLIQAQALYGSQDATKGSALNIQA